MKKSTEEVLAQLNGTPEQRQRILEILEGPDAKEEVKDRHQNVTKVDNTGTRVVLNPNDQIVGPASPENKATAAAFRGEEFPGAPPPRTPVNPMVAQQEAQVAAQEEANKGAESTRTKMREGRAATEATRTAPARTAPARSTPAPSAPARGRK